MLSQSQVVSELSRQLSQNDAKIVIDYIKNIIETNSDGISLLMQWKQTQSQKDSSSNPH
jgi:hypothetical protein